ncbi:MAG: hypothetical protein DIU69_13105 [Bacillota bacterium]|nr:MAG: hypothetical protein DIU69_13105 [Bacillota bacterium]
MTMEEWIRATFPVYDDFGCEVFEFKANGLTVQADMAIFLSIFGNVPAPPTAASLKAADPENKTGWHWCFDAWAHQGIIAAG